MPSKDSPTRPAHKRSVSSMSAKTYFTAHAGIGHRTSSEERTQYAYVDFSTNGTTRTSSRIMTSVRRSIGSFPKKRGPQSPRPSDYGMISTPAERTVSTSTRYRDYNANSRPTVEQIAMGLHTSRTPHLRPLSPSPNPYSHSHRSASPVILPPAPARSSLKKPTTLPAKFAENNPASSSSTTVTSTNSPAPRSSTSSITSIKVRMARFLPRYRNASAPPSVLSSSGSSPRTSVEFHTPKKAVRFSTQVEPVSDEA
ncbi:hypothetical protein LshimejAT787_1303030 [Lyophyllum shimeji]|uniref:Uncharacterized protein n=1 Tax=Lyophyllum shimeji TaxID=47721 RepID=A0A9P3PUY5_LYOSH|nr:hypothetical protein LshimejAT787_1303030 [Lyophyllum shimeji]